MRLAITGIFTREQIETINKLLEDLHDRRGVKLIIQVEALLEHDILDRAAYVFDKLDLHTNKSEQALLLISVASRRYAFLPNNHLSEKLDEDILIRVQDILDLHLKQENYYEAMVAFIELFSNMDK